MASIINITYKVLLRSVVSYYFHNSMRVDVFSSSVQMWKL